MNNPTFCQIEVKPGVVFHPATWHYPEMWRIVFVVKMTAPPYYTPTITSAVEGRHLSTSFHYFGGALDWRINDFPKSGLARWIEQITKKLGSDYYVELGVNYIHIHWKLMKKQPVFP